MLTTKQRIRSLLTTTGLFDDDRVDEILSTARENGLSIREAALTGGELKEEVFLEKLAGAMALPFQRLKDPEIDGEVLARLPTKAIFQYNVVPIAAENSNST